MVIEYTPHAAQMEIHRARGFRFRTVCTGRRFGKTLCMAAELLDRGGGDPLSPVERALAECAAQGVGFGPAGRIRDYAWVAPTYGVAERGVEAFRTIASDFVRIVGRMPARAEFEGAAGPCRVWFLSADNPDSIRGFGFRGIVLDEAAAVPASVWNYVLRPTLAQTMGWAVFISTPMGRNWFYDMFTRGVEGQAGFKSFAFPSNVSPYFPAKEWESAKLTLPEDVFRQEYMAEFLEDGAGVFRGIEGCLVEEGGPSKPDGLRRGDYRDTVIGCDVAKHTDWTVLIAMEVQTGRCLAMERFNLLDWPVQRERIAGFVKKWGGQLVMDATGVGDPVFDDLRREFPDTEGYRITAQSKRELVQGLMMAVEQRRVTWPAAWEVLTAEMRRYEYAAGPSGQVTYSAPSGYHDDCVMALALAVWGCRAAGVEQGRMIRMPELARGWGRRGNGAVLGMV